MSSKITKNKRKSTSEQLKRLATLKTTVKSDEPVNSFEITVKQQLAEIIGRLGSIEQTISELRTNLKDGQNRETIIGTVDPAESNRLGIPIANLSELKLFESRLETAEFYDDVVRKTLAL